MNEFIQLIKKLSKRLSNFDTELKTKNLLALSIGEIVETLDTSFRKVITNLESFDINTKTIEEIFTEFNRRLTLI